jgi:hypothetical protein
MSQRRFLKMNAFRRLNKPVFASLVGLGLCLVVGCGDDTGLEKRYRVSGTVSYNGKPVEKGQISFIPDDIKKQREATGFIENGQFTLTTSAPGDGALPGEYKVTVVSKEVDDSKVTETVKKYGGGGRQSEIAKANAAGKMLVPGKYALADTSDLKATVKPEANSFTFELKD